MLSGQERRIALVLACALTSGVAAATIAQRPDAFTASRDDPSIQYSTRSETTDVTRLNQHLAEGTSGLTFDATNGYLGPYERAYLRARLIGARAAIYYHRHN